MSLISLEEDTLIFNNYYLSIVSLNNKFLDFQFIISDFASVFELIKLLSTNITGNKEINLSYHKFFNKQYLAQYYNF